MKKAKKWLLGIGLVLGVGVLAVAISWGWLLSTQPALTVGPETTVIEGPLREDGTVDYVAALNNQYSNGVTPENNAFAALVTLIPPDSDEAFASVRPQVFEKLGIAIPDDDARFLVPIETYAEQRADDEPRWVVEAKDEPSDDASSLPRWEMEWERAQEGPWADEDAPLVAEWLVEHANVLDRAREAVARERYWSPFVQEDPDGLLIGVLLPHLSWARQLGLAWTVRARHRLAVGDIEGAVSDLLAARRLGHHLAHRPILIEQMVGFAISGVAAEAVTDLAADEALSAEQARDFRNAFAALGGRVPLTETTDAGERFVLLDFLQRLGLGPDAMAASNDGLPPFVGRVIDRNRAMREVNGTYDRMVEATEQPTRPQRLNQWEQVGDDVEQRARRWNTPSTSWIRIAVGSRAAITDATSAMLLDYLAPAVDRAETVADETATADRLASVALAVAGYRAEHGQYPETLDALVPTWLDEVPTDLFAEEAAPLRYRLEDDGIVIYSVGRNGEDDGGVEAEDRGEGDQVVKWSR